MGLIVNHELNLTEVRFHQLASVVDIFVILESSITSGIHHSVLIYLMFSIQVLQQRICYSK